MTTYQVGSNVDSWCTKCKLMLAHTIEAIVESVPKKVQCNTCASKHVHRPYAPGEKPKTTRTTRGTSAAAAKRMMSGVIKASDYDTLMKGRDVADAVSYSFREKYVKGDMINHIKFGAGLVLVDKGSNKVEVIFEEGPKTLVHARA